ncbi:hypothetical protein [Mucilaginibacter gracilis]|nr:hypothetical protein [Mucilaginibacter gracilis]
MIKKQILTDVGQHDEWLGSGYFNSFPGKKFSNTIKLRLLKCRAIFILGLTCFCSSVVFAQDTFEHSMALKFDSLLNSQSTAKHASGSEIVLYPDDAPSSLMSPTGFGGSGTYIYGGIGGTYPELYTDNKADLILFGGLSFGDPAKIVNVAIGVNVTDVHRFSDFSANLNISRQLPRGSSISIGTYQLLSNPNQTDSEGNTFYFAFGHAVQWARSKTPGLSALSYSIGFGTGRFLYKSPNDVDAGKGKYGTAVFCNVSYEIIRHVNLNAEWYGTNMGVSAGIRPFKNPLSICVGVDNLTKYSGDKPSMVFTIGYPLSVKRSTAK